MIKNKSVFLAPVWTDDYTTFVCALRKDARYIEAEKGSGPQYMLPYINRIYGDSTLFSEFELKGEYIPRICTFEKYLSLSSAPVLNKIRLSCFSTGCVFAELHIEYSELDIEEIADFSFHFKNAKRRGDEELPTMEEALSRLMPEKVAHKLFFTAKDFKLECKIFHRICTGQPLREERLESCLVHLRRGYHRGFSMPKTSCEYDMIYQPYSYDSWAGSQEGLVNIYNFTGDETTDKFLENYKPLQLDNNYFFMYLLLLNQRFSAISYLDKISESEKYTRRAKEKLNLKISRLKTVFSFSVVSDDQLYQNLYTKMYAILDIDRLLCDIHDSESQIDMLRNNEMLESEKKTSTFLFALSVLSLFSVLVDAAGYFDRFSLLEKISTPLSLVCLIAIVISYLVWMIKYRMK